MSLADVIFSVIPNPLYLGLCYQDPDLLQDPLTAELMDPSYVRRLFVWTRTDNSFGSGPEQRFYGIQAGTNVVAMALFDSPVNGNMLFSYLFVTPYHFTKGGYLSINGLSVSIPN